MQLKNSVYAYDISASKQRRRALRQLRKVADVYQDSVFDCRLAQSAHQALQQSLLALLSAGEQVLYIALPQNTQCFQLGSGLQPLNANSFVIS
jgi:CRISPR/Cas system-associated endoribonuclease Cas2